MQNMKLAPVVLFTYNRAWHTKKSIDALRNNVLANQSELFIFSDGPRSTEEKVAVDSVRKDLKTIIGFEKVHIIAREGNLGLANSIISGVSEIVNRFGRVIVLEDDLVCSPFFLKYMNEALDYYEKEEEVISIHGYIYPVAGKLPETFFLKGADCWGWATWKRGWDLFEPDGKRLLDELRHRNLRKEFDFNGAYPYTKMLEDQIRGKNTSWAIRWYASAFLNGRLTLYPGRSLIQNIGTDESGTHFRKTNVFNVEISKDPIAVSEIPIEENMVVKREIERYLRTVNPGLAEQLKNRIARLFF
jgi:glycosyltransferase involved in cell wall biosynthesis